MWIWQQKDWPKFYWNDDIIVPILRQVRFKQGQLFGKSEGLTDQNRAPLSLDTMLQNIITSCATCSFKKKMILSMKEALLAPKHLRNTQTP